ncbi:MAG TPA: glycoside hydrolase family 3 N-terminal domain-containing protein [Candidatus Saccharimonadales bacterium]|jgi:beta-N-acetylhexosaminidase
MAWKSKAAASSLAVVVALGVGHRNELLEYDNTAAEVGDAIGAAAVGAVDGGIAGAKRLGSNAIEAIGSWSGGSSDTTSANEDESDGNKGVGAPGKRGRTGDNNGNDTEDDPLASCVAKMPLDDRIGQTHVVGIPADTLESAADVFSDESVGGVLLMPSPKDGPGERYIYKYTKNGEIKAFIKKQKYKPLVTTDEEGGSVQRYKDMHELPSAAEVASSKTPEQAGKMIEEHGKRLNPLGINWILGTVVDRAQGDDPPLGDRLFSRDQDEVAAFAAAEATGWEKAGILPTMKHWPGGVGSANTDYEVGITPDFKQIQKKDYKPYKYKGKMSIMVSNAVVPGLSEKGVPVSLSRKAVTGQLREKDSFDGLITVDALNAVAVKATGKSVPEAVAESFAAGVDMPLYVADSSSLRGQIKASKKALRAFVKEDPANEEQLNASVVRIMREKKFTC